MINFRMTAKTQFYCNLGGILIGGIYHQFVSPFIGMVIVGIFAYLAGVSNMKMELEKLGFKG